MSDCIHFCSDRSEVSLEVGGGPIDAEITLYSSQ